MKDSTFMSIAEIISKESKCISLQVGAVLVKDDRIISTGYNGTPSGHSNCNELLDKEFTRTQHHEWSKKNEIHAELNVILFAAKNGISTKGSTLYVTHSPCADCSKAITQSGIKKVIYNEKYHRSSESWADILIKSDIEVSKLKEK